MSVRILAPAILLLSAALVTGPRIHAQSPASTISLEDRVRMATQIYHIVSTFFPGLPQEKFDVDYSEYLRVILRSERPARIRFSLYGIRRPSPRWSLLVLRRLA